MTWSHRWNIGKHGRGVQYLTLLQAGRTTFKLVINSEAPPRKASGYKGKTPINFPWNTCWRNSAFNRNSSWSSLKLLLHRIPAGRGFVCNLSVYGILVLCTHYTSSVRTVWNFTPGASHESRRSLQVLERWWRSHSLWCLHPALLGWSDAWTQQQLQPEVVAVLKKHQREGEVEGCPGKTDQPQGQHLKGSSAQTTDWWKWPQSRLDRHIFKTSYSFHLLFFSFNGSLLC